VRAKRAPDHPFLSAADETFARRLADARSFGAASEGLATSRPDLSAKSGLTVLQRAVGWAFVTGVVGFLLIAPSATMQAFAVLLGSVFGLLIALRFLAAAITLLPRAALQPARLPDSQLWTLTILIPLLREEEKVVRSLVNAIMRLDYPAEKLDVKILVEADDDNTLRAVLAVDRPQWFEIIPVPPGDPRTKPKALNYGLASARGQFVAVFDAEDRPAPEQPRAAMSAFHAGGKTLAVVQAPLQIHNGTQGWIARQFQIEYAIHFRVWLPFLARLGLPLPLGGTSNYFRRDRLEAAGGWDAWNVTEDADIGLRLARLGGEARMIEPPTLEEAPSQLRPWLRQRTRWIKGHLQTWLVLMRKPFTAAREIGVVRFMATQLTFGGALLASAVHAPLLIWFLAGVLFMGGIAPWHLGLFATGYASVLFAAFAAEPRGVRRWPALLSVPLYWPLQSWAMLCALIEMKVKPHFWAKTPHLLADIPLIDIRAPTQIAPAPFSDNVIQLEFRFDAPEGPEAR